MTQYNVVYVVLDCLRTTNLGCYGYDRPTSPTIDSLAESGTVFDRVYCASNHTDPSFTSMMSGRYPLGTGILRHGHDITEEAKETLDATNTIFLPEILNAAGYTTLGISGLHRWHSRGFDHYGDPPISQGEEDGEAALTQQGLARLKQSVKRMKGRLPASVYDAIERAGIEAGLVTPAGDAHSITDWAIDHLESEDPDDFFFLLHYNDAHYPYDLPDELVEQFDDVPDEQKTPIETYVDALPEGGWRRRAENINLKGIEYVEDLQPHYDAGIRYVDRELTRLIETLESRGELEDTILVVTGDHGDNICSCDAFVGHHGLYESVAHVPLVLTGGPFDDGGRVDGFVQHLDLVPTLLETIGIDPSAFDFDGRSIVNHVKEGRGEFRDVVYTMDAAPGERVAIRDEGYTFILSLNGERPFLDDASGQAVRELYRADDTHEGRNLVDERPEVAEQYEERLRNWVDEQRSRREDRRTLVKRLEREAVFGELATAGADAAQLLEDLYDGLGLNPPSGAPGTRRLFAATLFHSVRNHTRAEGEDDEEAIERRLRDLGYIE